MLKSALILPLLFASVAAAGDCAKCEYSVGYVEETVVVKKPVLIKRTPIVETREKQVTVKEQVVTGYKEEIVEVPVRKHKPLFGGIFKKKYSCDTCN